MILVLCKVRIILPHGKGLTGSNEDHPDRIAAHAHSYTAALVQPPKPGLRRDLCTDREQKKKKSETLVRSQVEFGSVRSNRKFEFLCQIETPHIKRGFWKISGGCAV